VLEYLLAHGLQLVEDVHPFLLADIQRSVYLVHFIIDIIVEFLIELVLYVLRQVVVKKLVVRELRLWELRERAEVGRVLEALDVHHVGELEVRWRRHLLLLLAEIRGVHLPIVHVSELVDVVVGRLIYLTYLALTRNLSSKLLSWTRLLWMRHEILWASSHELLVDIEWLLPTVLSMVDDTLYALTQVLGVTTADIGCLLRSVKLLGHVDWLLIRLFVLMLHLELTISHQLVRYVYNGGRLFILPLNVWWNHIVIGRLILIRVILIFIHIFFFITLLFIIIWWVLVVIDIARLNLWLITVIVFKGVGLMLHLLLRLVVALL